MKKTDQAPQNSSRLVIHFEAPDLSPSDLNVRLLVRALEPAAKIVEAVEDERGIKRALPVLEFIDEGSISIALSGQGEDWDHAVSAIYGAVQSGLKGLGEEVRGAFRALTKFATQQKWKTKIGAWTKGEKAAAAELELPLDLGVVSQDWLETTFSVHGTVAEVSDSGWLKIQMEMGGRRRFQATEAIVRSAADLFEKPVRCTASLLKVGGEETWSITSIEAWPKGSLLAALLEARKQQEAAGVVVSERDIFGGID